MFAYVFDLVVAYLLGGAIKRTWILILASIAAGIISAVLFTLLAQQMTGEAVGATMGRIVFGLFIHPTLTVIASLLRRRKALRVADLFDPTEKEKRRQAALDTQAELRRERSK